MQQHGGGKVAVGQVQHAADVSLSQPGLAIGQQHRQGHAQAHNPSTAAIMGCMEPLTAVSMGVLFLGERFGLGQVLGVAIVLVAVFIVILSSHPGHFSMKRLIPAFIKIRK